MRIINKIRFYFWRKNLLKEFSTAPKYENDDFVDAYCGSLKYLRPSLWSRFKNLFMRNNKYV
nr:hypothetical protein GTC16762_33880 [Pigmentibacter ruber]